MFLKLIAIRNQHQQITETNEFKTQHKILYCDFLRTGSFPWVFSRWSRGLFCQQHFIVYEDYIALTWFMQWQLPHNEL